MAEKDKAQLMVRSLDKIYDFALEGMPALRIDSIEELAGNYVNGSGDLQKEARSLVRWQVTKAGTSGFLSGLGGALTLPVTLPANITHVLFVQVRMIAAIAYMAGLNPRDDKVRTMVYVCLTGKSAADILKGVGIKASQQLATTAIKRIPVAVIHKINRAVGFRLVTKFGTKGTINLGRMIPLAGGVIGGSFDSTTTYACGKTATKIFVADSN